MQEKVIYGKYVVTDEGKVFNKETGNELKGGYTSRDRNYRCVCLSPQPGKQKTCYIHRLVAEAFIPNPHNLQQVNHIDGNTKNNHASNLEWCTPSENVKHSYKIGLHKSSLCLLCGREIYNKKIHVCGKCRRCFGDILESEILRLRNIETYQEILDTFDAKLNDEQVDIFLLKIQGYTYEEIAKKQGCTKQNVYLKISKFIEEFKNMKGDVKNVSNMSKTHA